MVKTVLFILCILATKSLLAEDFTNRLIDLNSATKAKIFGQASFTKSNRFDWVLSTPMLFPARVDGIDYVYAITRVKTIASSMNLKLTRIEANSPNFPVRLEEWELVEYFSVPIAESNLSHTAMAFKDRIHISWKEMREGNKVGKIIVKNLSCLSKVKNKKKCIEFYGNVSDVPGYKNRNLSEDLSLVRIPSKSLSTVKGRDEFFDTNRGRPIALHSCSVKGKEDYEENGGCPWGEGVFIQEYFYEKDRGPYLGKPIKIFIPNYSRLREKHFLRKASIKKMISNGSLLDDHGNVISNTGQNFNASTIGGKTLVLSWAFNSYHDEPERPANRDFPTYSAFIKFDDTYRTLNQAAREEEDFLDRSKRSYYSDDKLQKMALRRSGSPWDQAALWTTHLFVNPYSPEKALILYESWGSSRKQKNKTKNDLYPGTARPQYIGLDSEAVNETCHSYCADRDVLGGKCLSAELIGGNHHGRELKQWERSSYSAAWFIEKMGAEKVSYQCAEIGTTVNRDNDELAILTVGVESEETIVAKSGHKICKDHGYKGFIFMEWSKTKRKFPDGVGKTLLRERPIRFKKGENIIVGCSTEFKTEDFFNVDITGSDQYCDNVCDNHSMTHSSLGSRSYRSEITESFTTKGKHSMLNFVNGGTLMSKNLITSSIGVDKYWERKIVNSNGEVSYYPDAEIKRYSMRCICGPSQSLNGRAVYRKVHIDL